MIVSIPDLCTLTYFVYIHTLFMQVVKALSSLCLCSDLTEPSLHDNAICTKITCTRFYLMFDVFLKKSYTCYLSCLDLFTTKHYMYFESVTSWNSAREVCEIHGGQLLTIPDIDKWHNWEILL